MLKLEKRLDIPCGQTYLASTHDGHFLECGDVFMSKEIAYGTRPYRFQDFDRPSDLNKRVMTICTMAGCPMNCKFCACRRSLKRKLTCSEIVGQVDFMIQQGVKLGRDPDPNRAKEFRVLYTRMGEPMLNSQAVIESIHTLIKRYPHIIIGLSTSGVRSGLDLLIENASILPHIDMQFSLHTTCDKERDYLFGRQTKLLLTIPEIAKYTKAIYQAYPKKISLNMILFDNYTYDISSLMQHFDKEHIWLRLSPWNVVKDAQDQEQFVDLLKTEDVFLKKPVSSAKLKKIIDEIEQLGITYAYAPAIDEEIKYQVACGQTFEAFKDEVGSMALEKSHQCR